jgi:hypothetical protein
MYGEGKREGREERRGGEVRGRGMEGRGKEREVEKRRAGEEKRGLHRNIPIINSNSGSANGPQFAELEHCSDRCRLGHKILLGAP